MNALLIIKEKEKERNLPIAIDTMRGCFGVSIIGLQMKWLDRHLRSMGLRPESIEIDEYTTMHCWAPCNNTSPKPALLLLHGFGGNGMMSWNSQIASLLPYFNLYIPDLLCFGDSLSTSHDITLEFQAHSIVRMMAYLGLDSVSAVVGHSYGGFVTYVLAHMYPAFTPRIVIIGSAVFMRPESTEQLLRDLGGIEEINEMLVPTKLSSLRKGVSIAFHKFPTWIPDCLMIDMMETFEGDREKKLQVLHSIINENIDMPPPKVNQDVLIVWGEYDHIFNISLAHDLKGHIGRRAKLVIIKNCGHNSPIEKPKELNKALLEFC